MIRRQRKEKYLKENYVNDKIKDFCGKPVPADI